MPIRLAHLDPPPVFAVDTRIKAPLEILEARLCSHWLRIAGDVRPIPPGGLVFSRRTEITLQLTASDSKGRWILVIELSRLRGAETEIALASLAHEETARRLVKALLADYPKAPVTNATKLYPVAQHTQEAAAKLEDAEPWRQIPPGPDREAVKMWWEGATKVEITNRLDDEPRKPKTMENYFSSLRRRYGPDVVPHRVKLIQQSKNKKGKPKADQG